MSKSTAPDFGILSPEHKVFQLFADKVVIFLSYLILAFIVIDSFINLLPGSSHPNVRCFIAASGITPGQQSYIDSYCADKAPKVLYVITMLIFAHGLVTVLLHYSWYSMVVYTKSHSKVKDAETGNATQATNGTTQTTNGNTTQEANGNTKKASWLGLFYAIKNILQISIALAAVITTLLYELVDAIPAFKNNFNCTIAGKIDYWAGLDTVQCYYDSLAIKDSFFLFYTVVSGCIIFVAFFGLLDFFIRPDLKNKPCFCRSTRKGCCKCFDNCCGKCCGSCTNCCNQGGSNDDNYHLLPADEPNHNHNRCSQIRTNSCVKRCTNCCDQRSKCNKECMNECCCGCWGCRCECCTIPGNADILELCLDGDHNKVITVAPTAAAPTAAAPIAAVPIAAPPTAAAPTAAVPIAASPIAAVPTAAVPIAASPPLPQYPLPQHPLPQHPLPQKNNMLVDL